MLKQYFDAQKNLHEKYGDKCVTFFENGTFFEAYGMKRDDIHMQACIDLNIAISQKSSSFMGGFKPERLDQNLQILLDLGWTVAVFTQQKVKNDVDHTESIARTLNAVYSPGTFTNTSDEKYGRLGSILLEQRRNKKWSANVVTFDCRTGDVSIFENFVVCDDYNYAANQTKSMLKSFELSELLVHVISPASEDENRALGKSVFMYENFCLTHIQSLPPRRDAILESSLKKYYAHKISQVLSIYQTINVTDVSAIRNLVSLLDFLNDHEATLLKKLHIPKVLEGCEDMKSNHLQCHNNMHVHLNIFDAPRGYKSLFQHCNKTRSKVGKALLMSRVQRPLRDVEQLKFIYDCVEDVKRLNSEHPKRKHFSIYLDGFDLSKLMRLCEIGKGTIDTILGIVSGNENVIHLVEELTQYENVSALKSLIPSTYEKFQAFHDSLNTVFDISKCTNREYNCFRPGVYKELDVMEKELCETESNMKNRMNEILSWTRLKENDIKMVIKDKTVYLETSASKAQKLEKYAKDFEQSDVSFSYHNKTALIECRKFQLLQSKYVDLKLNFGILHKQYISEQLESMHSQYFENCIECHIDMMAQMDVAVSSAELAIQFSYCKPSFFEEDGETYENIASKFEVKQLRHPVAERMVERDKGLRYIAHDLELGDEHPNRILFGWNSSGKSMMLKAVACAILMAQAGMYVSASEFTFRPYEHLMARTGNGDDLYHHQSSFIRELEEIHTILRFANPKTLVISDELCSTTETYSAKLIAGAFMHSLLQKRSSFFFASHLFELAEECEEHKVRICHLAAEVTNDSGIVYHRRLMDGLPSETKYGVIVARNTIRDETFLRQLTLNSKKRDFKTVSRYNSSHVVECCDICGYKPRNARDKELETHHIHQQCCADKHGRIQSFHKNERHNLTTVCHECHVSVHKGDIIIFKYLDTDSGRKLIWKRKEDEDPVFCEEIEMNEKNKNYDHDEKRQKKVGSRPQDDKPQKVIENREEIEKFCKENAEKSVEKVWARLHYTFFKLKRSEFNEIWNYVSGKET